MFSENMIISIFIIIINITIDHVGGGNMADQEKSKQNEKDESQEQFIKKIFNFLSSMKAGILLLILVAVISSIGTFIPQEHPPEQYHEQYSELVSSIILALGLDNIFEVWWFVGLIALLCANLFLCSLKRLPGIYRRAFYPKKILDENQLQNYNNSATIKVEDSQEEVVSKVSECFRVKKYNTEVLEDESSGEKVLFAERGKLGYFGSFLTHLSIVILVLGFAYGNRVGFENFVSGQPGDIMEIEERNFEVRVDDFEIDYRDDYSVDQYYSTLTVMEENEEIKQEEIYVNNPLRYDGINFYQSTHGWMGDVQIKNKETDITDDVSLYEESHYHITDNTTLMFHSFYPDYHLGPDGPTNKSPIPNNPRFIWMIYEGGEIADMFVTEPEEAVEYQDKEIQFTDYNQYTGLRVVHDPGIPVFFFGSFVMVVGLIMSFYMFPKRIWVRVKTKDGSSQLIIGGQGLKDRQSFTQEFNELVEDLSKEENL